MRRYLGGAVHLVSTISRDPVVTASYRCTGAQLDPLLDVCNGSAIPQLVELSSRAQISAYLLAEYTGQLSVSIRALIAHGIMECRGDPNEPISFRHTSGRLWNDHYQLGVHNSSNSTWTLREFLLHYIHDAITAAK